ncbi:LANO_0E05226g1_1 [Lachancea nothofagi CBS 11611]|uniref:LANO_0E05226g1_1 n=1 Tax=Lachancea nothofagi CBS 11611 TaxID=1266666 RepID=A0A1G4JSU2_9SACH|nr:LANO_0E05226g1_1 [Lachancea nothofagi CBS 11611]
MSDSRRKRYSINFSAPASPISPTVARFPSEKSAGSHSARPFSARTQSARPSSAYGLGVSRSESLRNSSGKSFYRIPNDDQRNVSLDSLSDFSSIKLLLIGDAAVGKTAMILSYCNELPTRSQASLVTKGNLRTPSLESQRKKRLQHLKTIEKRKRYSLNDYEELFHNQSAVGGAPSIMEVAEPDSMASQEDPNEILIDTRSTIGVDIRTNLVNIDNRYFKVTMWDTAGQERYRNAMIPSLYKGSNGVLLSYDICNKKSFENCLDYWLEEVINCCSDDKLLKIYLVGNKIDLYKVRQVTHEDVLRYISKAEANFGVQIAGNFEVSCKWHQVVERTFNNIIKDLVEHGCYENNHLPSDDSLDGTQNQSQETLDPGAMCKVPPIEIQRRGSTIVRRRPQEKKNTVDITKPLGSEGSNGGSACCV